MSSAMSKPTLDADTILKRAAPVTGQHAHEIQPFGHLVRMPIALSEHACKESVDNLNQLLADTRTLRDLYKKHHWQVAGPTFYQLHLLFDKHYDEQNEARAMARRAAEAVDDGTNDLIVSGVIRRNELQIWFVAEHIVNVPIVEAG